MKQILAEIRSNGFDIDTLVCDGKVHRFTLGRDDRKESGWYCAFQNFSQRTGEAFYVVTYGSWRDGILHKAQTDTVQLSPEDKATIKKQISEAHRKADAERARVQGRVAEEAIKKWDSLGVGELPAYFIHKGITQPYGTRSAEEPFTTGFTAYVPMRDISDKLWNIESICPPDGKVKKGIYGGRRIGLFHLIGEVRDVIYIAEGFATAVAIHVATEEAVVVCFNAGNMPHVAKELLKKWSDKKFIVCGDNDQFNEKNVGAEKAGETANILSGKVILPTFKDLSSQPKDFDDLFRLEGIDEVRSQILKIDPLEAPEACSVEYILNAPYPDENLKTGTKKGTMMNVAELLHRLRIVVRYNVISKEEEILIPGGAFSVDNKANATLSYVIDWCMRVGIPVENLSGYITAIADRNPYNPVATWIDSRPWDGQSRLRDFYETVESTNEPLKERLMRAWMISAIAAAYRPNGVSAAGVLVFQGDQYIGKTKWFKSLVPAHLELSADGSMLRPDDKDSVFQVISKWMVELGELDATFRKADIAQLKAFTTKDHDVIRRPYAKKESHYARRTVFFASVNELDFLKDPTGNRRFWTIACKFIDHSHSLDMQQVWAEFKSFYDVGESWYLNGAEIEALNKHNETFQIVEPVEERILSYFENGNSLCPDKLSASDICKRIGILNPSTNDCRVAGRALRKHFDHDPKLVRGLLRFNVPHVVANS